MQNLDITFNKLDRFYDDSFISTLIESSGTSYSTANWSADLNNFEVRAQKVSPAQAMDKLAIARLSRRAGISDPWFWLATYDNQLLAVRAFEKLVNPDLCARTYQGQIYLRDALTDNHIASPADCVNGQYVGFYGDAMSRFVAGSSTSVEASFDNLPSGAEGLIIDLGSVTSDILSCLNSEIIFSDYAYAVQIVLSWPDARQDTSSLWRLEKHHAEVLYQRRSQVLAEAIWRADLKIAS